MGFPTPFPEPDSPELQRFAVRSSSEIVNRLRTLQQAAVPLTAFVDAGTSFGVVTLQSVDETAGKLVFVGTASDGLHERLLGAPLTTFVGFDQAGKVQFAVCPATGGRGAGDQTLATPIPAQLFSLQRRSAARMRVNAARQAVCRIPVPGGDGHWEALRVLDIGTGGIAVLAYPERFEPALGSEIDGCWLDLPGVGGTAFSLRVCHANSHPSRKQARSFGFEFVRISPVLHSELERYLRSAAG